MVDIAHIPPRKLPKQDRSRTTVDYLVEATARILTDEGIEHLSTNRIAELAGVSVGSLYQYFPNKEALLTEVRRRYDEAFMERTVAQAGRIGALPLREGIREFIRFMLEIHAENPRLHNALAERVPESQRRFLLQVVLAYLEAHREELRVKNLELAALISLEVGEALTHGASLRYPERLTDERFAEEILDLLVRYLEA